MTVEASLVLPVFLMLFMNLLSIIEVYRIHSNVAATLWEQGRKTAQYSYLKNAGNGTWTDNGDIGVSYLTGTAVSLISKQQIVKNLGSYPIWEKIVAGGTSGFTVTGQTDHSGIITINCKYCIHPLFSALTPLSKTMGNRYYGHAFTGYELGAGNDTGNENDSYVYITETGTVYHNHRECSYLNPAIHKVFVSQLGELRNYSGAKYYACPLCDDRSLGTSCYITDYGTNYHTDTGCSGLKRTIYEVKLSEVGSRRPCSKCEVK